jgi:TM2 domain-containing membrane protein YozV
MRNRCFLNAHAALLVFLLLIMPPAPAQNPVNCNLKFVNHLVNKGDYIEAIYLLDSTDCQFVHSDDSINYLRGWSLYSLKQLLPSAESLLKVKPGSEFYLKSHFFAAYDYTHIGNYEDAIKVLSQTGFSTGKQSELKELEIAGIYLLQGDTVKFSMTMSKINKDYYGITDSYANLQKIALDLKNHKKKSPVIAGLLSGIIPGSGKFYSGKKGEAISAFISNVGLGLVTWENYRKSGIKSFKTIVFGTAFAFSYAANIYGAIVTVNIVETEYRDNVRSSILFNLHIPLRNSFDR